MSTTPRCCSRPATETSLGKNESGYRQATLGAPNCRNGRERFLISSCLLRNIEPLKGPAESATASSNRFSHSADEAELLEEILDFNQVDCALHLHSDPMFEYELGEQGAVGAGVGSEAHAELTSCMCRRSGYN